MFPQARRSRLDLKELGAELLARKNELMAHPAEERVH